MSTLRLTDEQRAALDAQIAAKPADRRIGVPLTAEQAADYREAVAKAEAGKEEMIARARKLHAAEQEPGLFGDLRRAINASRVPREVIAGSIGATPSELEDFRTGAAPLPPNQLNRLVSALGLRLMQEIPRRRDPVTDEGRLALLSPLLGLL